MTPEELRAILARLDLSQTAAAPLLGASPSRVHRWASGAEEIARSAVLLLRLYDGVPGALDAARAEAFRLTKSAA